MFSLVVLLVGEKKLPLALCNLSSLYAILDKCSCYIFKSVGRYDMVSYADALDVFVGEVQTNLPRPGRV